jgi:mucin-19
VGYPTPNNPPASLIDLGAANMGYPNGDFARGAPANAGGGGTSHNSGGGGGGNGGLGGNGGQTFNGDNLRDVGGFGGSRLPQNGSPAATRIYMGGGGSGSLNNDTGNRGHGGYGGGIIAVRAGSISGSAVFQSNGQKAIDSDAGNDAGGGGGAGGSIMIVAGSGHGNVSAIARGGYGNNSNLNTSNTAFAPPTGTAFNNCCGGEREGPGGGGGVVLYNSVIGNAVLARGINGLSREDKAQGFSGNMLAAPGTDGAAATIVPSTIPGVRAGYECLPLLTASKFTTTGARTVPPDTTASYTVVLSNAPTAGVAMQWP